jgi:hypothetical protein
LKRYKSCVLRGGKWLIVVTVCESNSVTALASYISIINTLAKGAQKANQLQSLYHSHKRVAIYNISISLCRKLSRVYIRTQTKETQRQIAQKNPLKCMCNKNSISYNSPSQIQIFFQGFYSFLAFFSSLAFFGTLASQYKNTAPAALNTI